MDLMPSIQTLSEADRRTVARWAAACASRVLPLFATDVAEADAAIRDACARAHAFSRGESAAAVEIGKRMIAVKAAKHASTPAGAAAARAVAQASGVAHMGAHALGATAYAVKAVSLAEPGHAEAIDAEIAWQLAELTDREREVLSTLPPVGSDSAGPLGRGLLAQGVLGETISTLQRDIGTSTV